ncbi:hypothetical protein O9929_20735 [Vibrio lentus]|nr:hypothetical protein [Vibrio lentus]
MSASWCLTTGRTTTLIVLADRRRYNALPRGLKHRHIFMISLFIITTVSSVKSVLES